MKYFVAAASGNGISVDTHFGYARTYRIIGVDDEQGTWETQETRNISLNDELSGDGGCFGHDEGTIAGVAEQLKDCRYVLVEKIGARPQKILQRNGLEVLETDMKIDDAVRKIIQYQKKHELSSEEEKN
ncbi:MAG: hypothetical protein LUE96_07675 [Lachnospiraceae bacterium]|nr:hypothetical protein [Lachnospiraceae bacterium]